MQGQDYCGLHLTHSFRVFLGLQKIADFGLATQLSRADEKHLTMCGTPNYISPEVMWKCFRHCKYKLERALELPWIWRILSSGMWQCVVLDKNMLSPPSVLKSNSTSRQSTLQASVRLLTCPTLRSVFLWNGFVSCFLLAGHLPGLLFEFEDGASLFLQNISYFYQNTCIHIPLLLLNLQHLSWIWFNEVNGIAICMNFCCHIKRTV